MSSSSSQSEGQAIGGSIGNGAGSSGLSVWDYIIIGAVALIVLFLWLKFKK